MRFPFAVLLLAMFGLAQTNAAPPAKPWQSIDGCRWKADRWNDGDSFHVITGDEAREIVARLYFVDTHFVPPLPEQLQTQPQLRPFQLRALDPLV